jgi:hypothetical protein
MSGWSEMSRNQLTVHFAALDAQRGENGSPSTEPLNLHFLIPTIKNKVFTY